VSFLLEGAVYSRRGVSPTDLKGFDGLERHTAVHTLDNEGSAFLQHWPEGFLLCYNGVEYIAHWSCLT